jgi:EmrB/QacA subfamily drug resistance transporter
MNQLTSKERFILIATILSSGIVLLDGSVVNVALPTIARGLHTDYSGLQWVIDGYALTLSSLILVAGSFGDLFGLKRIFQIGLITFGITSFICGLAPTASFLILMRILQGVSGALLVPSGLAVINTNIDNRRVSKAIGAWSGFGSAFAALGPLVGGLLIPVSWRLIFFINLPIVAVTLYFTKYVQASKRTGPKPQVDWVGALLAVVGLGATTYSLIEGPPQGWKMFSLPILILGLLSLVGFIFYERYYPKPMLPLGLFKFRNFSGSNAMTLFMYAALSGVIFSLVLYLQTALGYAPIEAGLAFLPVTIIMFFFAGRAGALSAKYGARIFMTAGPLIQALGIFLLLFVSPTHSNYFLYIFPAAIIFGIGLATTVAPLTTTVMQSVDQARSGITSAVNNAVARLAGLLIVAFLGIVVVANTTSAIASNHIPNTNSTSHAIQQSVAGGVKNLPDQNHSASFLSAVMDAQRGTYTDSLVICGVLLILSGLISELTIRTKKPQS